MGLGMGSRGVFFIGFSILIVVCFTACSSPPKRISEFRPPQVLKQNKSFLGSHMGARVFKEKSDCTEFYADNKEAIVNGEAKRALGRWRLSEETCAREQSVGVCHDVGDSDSGQIRKDTYYYAPAF